ncbi:MAG TPA: LysR family transcriptional regulator [Steroidobacteraceae bacterium]|jgi:DNA-binding transcriptional LysR family regulator
MAAVFVCVAETGSFTAAASALASSATMVGKHIRMLEKRLATPLIVRTTRRQA